MNHAFTNAVLLDNVYSKTKDIEGKFKNWSNNIFFPLQVKVWFQNRRTKHKRQQQEEEGGENKTETKQGEDEGLVLEHEEEELDVENEAETH